MINVWTWLGLLFALFIIISFHELGHALILSRQGYSIRKIYIGLPALINVRLFGVPVGFGPIVLIGAVMPEEEALNQTWKEKFSFAAAGPLFSLLLGILLVFIVPALFGLRGLSLIDQARAAIQNCEVSGYLWTGYFTRAMIASGPISYLVFVGFLSILLAVFNLIPIPPLDGGRMAFAVGEAVFGKRAQIVFIVIALAFACYLIIDTVSGVRDIAVAISESSVVREECV